MLYHNHWLDPLRLFDHVIQAPQASILPTELGPTPLLTSLSIFFQVPKIDKMLVDQLERLSLVEFSSEAGIKCLTAAIQSANQLYSVNTEGIEPLDTVLEDR